MERLPDLLVLDFCEWLQQSILRKAKYDSIDMWDLLFDDKYANVLERKSEEYCEQRIRQSEDWSNTVVREMLKRRINKKKRRQDFQLLLPLLEKRQQSLLMSLQDWQRLLHSLD